jgi:inosine-uridine nucleoside N-ribohydrolase
MSTPRLILDVDTGEDDALAILLAVRLGLPLAYVFTSYGNTTLANATRQYPAAR